MSARGGLCMGGWLMGSLFWRGFHWLVGSALWIPGFLTARRKTGFALKWSKWTSWRSFGWKSRFFQLIIFNNLFYYAILICTLTPRKTKLQIPHKKQAESLSSLPVLHLFYSISLLPAYSSVAEVSVLESAVLFTSMWTCSSSIVEARLASSSW